MAVELSKGILVAVEGIDGSGKSTQVAAVAEALRRGGLIAQTTREPTDGQYGLELRRSAREGRLSPERELELFMLDRAEHVATVIRPALTRGEVVLTDRYYFSTIAYQGARGFDRDALRRDNEAIAPVPDLLVILDVPVDEALVRIRSGRGETPNAFEQREMLKTSRDIFLDLARRAPCAEVVDGSRESAVVTRDILDALLRGPLGPSLSRSVGRERATSIAATVRAAP